MINPNCRRKLAWDWLVCAFVVFTTLATPLDLAFFDPSCRLEDPQARPRRRNAAGGRDAALRCACGANADCTLRERPQAPLASQFVSLTRACQAENLGNATLTTTADAAAYAEHRYAMRTACKPAALDGLDHLVRVRSPRLRAAHVRSARSVAHALCALLCQGGRRVLAGHRAHLLDGHPAGARRHRRVRTRSWRTRAQQQRR
jgi:hypothetical protein